MGMESGNGYEGTQPPVDVTRVYLDTVSAPLEQDPMSGVTLELTAPGPDETGMYDEPLMHVQENDLDPFPVSIGELLIRRDEGDFDLSALATTTITHEWYTSEEADAVSPPEGATTLKRTPAPLDKPDPHRMRAQRAADLGEQQ